MGAEGVSLVGVLVAQRANLGHSIAFPVADEQQGNLFFAGVARISVWVENPMLEVWVPFSLLEERRNSTGRRGGQRYEYSPGRTASLLLLTFRAYLKIFSSDYLRRVQPSKYRSE